MVANFYARVEPRLFEVYIVFELETLKEIYHGKRTY